MSEASPYSSFFDELQKISARKDISQLLSSLAQRRGVSPSTVPSIRQVGNIAQRDRSRAASVAGNVRKFLKGPASERMVESVPRSAPGLRAIGA